MKYTPFLLLPLLMAGCASTPETFPPRAADSLFPDKPIVTPVDAVSRPDIALVWTASGKMSIRLTQADGHESAATAYFVWEQHGNLYRVTLTGPLGQGRTVIEGTPERVTLDNAKTGHLEAESPESLMENALGWSAPVSYMHKWLQGRAATDQAETIYDDTGILKSSLEAPWQADFKTYQPADKYLLPQKFVVSGPNTLLTVLISRWHLE